MRNKLRYIFTDPKNTTILNSEIGKLIETCKHENTTEKLEIYKHIYPTGVEERYVFCNDCNKTIFAGWRPLYSKNKENNL